MNTKLSTKNKFNKMSVSILSIFVILAMAFPAMGVAYAQEPVPWLIAFPDNDAVEGWEWPDGATVTLTIDNAPDISWSGTAAVTTWGDPRTYVRFEFWEDYDLQAGDVVTLSTEGLPPVSHEVQELNVTEVDGDADTVAGTAYVGAAVQVWPHGFDQHFIEDTVEAGTWFADFGSLGFHAIEETGGRSQIVVDGNATAVDWHVTYPRFTVFPEWEFFDAYDWTEGATVAISVEDKPQCSFERESPGGFFNGDFPAGCDVQIGDTVTFTDGETDHTHTVQNLAVTKVAQEDDTVKGIADAGAEVYVWPHATGQEQLVIAKSNGEAEGKWNADFTEIFDLMPGECGRSEIRDESGNATAVDWCIPNPRIVASESGDWFWTTEFRPGMLDLFIYESADEGANLLWSGQQVADEWGFAIIGSDIHGQDLVPGNFLVISDGDSQKSLVLQPISVTLFDTQYEFMAGFAPPGSEVWAAAGPQDWQERIMVEADQNTGAWFADFAEIGFDITEDMRPWSSAAIYDEDGDANEGSTPPPPPPTATLIVIANQPDWVNSEITVSAGQSFTIEAVGLMNPCSDTYPNGAEYCIFYTPPGAEGVVPSGNEFGIFPGPGLRFMALLGRIDNGEPFYVGAGGTFIAEQTGTLWFTPNDNLRTDNQGAYSVLVWLEPQG